MTPSSPHHSDGERVEEVPACNCGSVVEGAWHKRTCPIWKLDHPAQAGQEEESWPVVELAISGAGHPYIPAPSMRCEREKYYPASHAAVLTDDDRKRLNEIAGELEHLPVEFRRHFDQDGRDARFLRKLAERKETP